MATVKVDVDILNAEIIESKNRIKELEANLTQLLLGLGCKPHIVNHLDRPDQYYTLGKTIANTTKEG